MENLIQHFGVGRELLALGQLVLAIVLGGVLGLQRERWGKTAGPRTYALVTAGSALFVIGAMIASSDTTAVGRIASQIITGIGFIGAGAILHHKDRIEGVTTAAGLWFTAAIGIAVGFELYLLAIGATVLTLLILSIRDERIPYSSSQGRPAKK